jgi:hypothetical protein
MFCVLGQVTCAECVGQQHAVQPAVDDSVAGSQGHAASTEQVRSACRAIIVQALAGLPS